MSEGAVLAVLALVVQSGVDAQVRATAQAQLPRAQALARDATILKAVAASNGAGESLFEIQRLDAAWRHDGRLPLRRQIIAAPCSERLRARVADEPTIVEAFVMDGQGALVCSTVETSDYWQGDEPKWIKTVREGRPSLVEEPALDMSTGIYAIQVSVPVLEGDRRVGAVTFTLKVRRDKVR